MPQPRRNNKSRERSVPLWCIARLSAVGLAVVMATTLPLKAETIRVSRWDMRTTPPGTAVGTSSETARIQFAADALKALKPDVIVLHDVTGWEMSTRVAAALQPADYRVVVCSAFPAAQPTPGPSQQVAILSRRKAYFTWSEAWQTPGSGELPGGLAFAAIEAGRQRLGVFSIQLDERLTAALSAPRGSTNAAIASACLRQWHNVLSSYRKWEANRIEAVTVSGAFSKEPRTTAAQLFRIANDFLGAPLDHVIPAGSGQSVFPARLPVNPDALAGVILNGSPGTCDVNLDPTNPPLASVVDSRPIKVSSPTPTAQPTATVAPRSSPQGWWEITNFRIRNLMEAAPAFLFSPAYLLGAASFFGFVLLVAFWRSARRKRKLRARLAATSALRLDEQTLGGVAGTVVISSSISGSAQDPRQTVHGQPLILIDSAARTETQSPLAVGLKKEFLQDRTLREHLTAWLKQKLVRRLISDRSELLNAQQQAGLKVMAVHERLSRIEAQIQQQNRKYELRIEELNRELLATKQENRALIHAKIVQVKTEMEAAKARIIAQARDLS